MEVKDILVKTKKVIEDGWCQGSFDDLKGNHCLVGAVHHAVRCSTYDDLKSPIFDRLRKAWAKVSKKSITKACLIGFNDSPRTTKEKVLRVVNTAIEMEK